jgi:hypothetical protein
MPKYQQDDEEHISDAVNLLISILVRYPEIGAINFDPDKQALKLSFMLANVPSPSQFAAIKKLMTDSIAAYHMLEGCEHAVCDLVLNNYDKVAMLTIRRDVGTLSKGEIALIITLVRERLKDLLVTDTNDTMLEEDLLIQEELIENMLESIKTEQAKHRLVGIREDGRVFVYNK